VVQHHVEPERAHGGAPSRTRLACPIVLGPPPPEPEQREAEKADRQRILPSAAERQEARNGQERQAAELPGGAQAACQSLRVCFGEDPSSQHQQHEQSEAEKKERHEPN
jgi:hypothetical protein